MIAVHNYCVDHRTGSAELEGTTHIQRHEPHDIDTIHRDEHARARTSDQDRRDALAGHPISELRRQGHQRPTVLPPRLTNFHQRDGLHH